MNIQVLVSTMNQRSEASLVKAMRLSSSYVIINQITDVSIRLKNRNTTRSKFLSFRERGLRKSRNRAICNANSEICVLADDDMYYEDGYEGIITKAYEQHPDADMIAFRVDNEDPKALSKEIPAGRVNLISSMKLSSIRITFKKKSITEAGVFFNEEFGAGAKFYMGEENLFLADCLKRGLKIYYVPEKIATLRLNENSSWFQGYDRKYFNVKGLVYYHISKLWYPLYIILFAVRKRHIYGSSVNLIDALKYMFEGVKMRGRKVYFAGDVISNTGPAQVNKNYYHFLKDKMYVCKSNNQLMRIAHFILLVLYVDSVVVSGLSKFHLDIIKVANKLGKKTFYLMHGYNALEYKINGIDNTDRLSLEKDILSQVGTIICVSEIFAAYLKSKESTYRGKIVFVNNGVYPISGVVSRKKNNHFTIMSVGGGMPRKRNLDLCRSIEYLNDDRIRFIVVGDKGRDGDKIRRYPFVRYYESLPHDKVQDLMSKSDLYVQNSEFETFGLAVCEAVASGCNLLVSEAVGALSVIEGLQEENIIKQDDDVIAVANRINRIMTHRSSSILTFKKNTEWYASSRMLMKIVRDSRVA